MKIGPLEAEFYADNRTERHDIRLLRFFERA
jgi:hypothetical protein